MSDLISRQAAIDAVKKHYRTHDNDLLELIAFDIERLPSAQEKPFNLPEIYIADGYDTIEGEDGNVGFGVYVPDENQIYVAGDVEGEIRARALFHEICHWVQAMCGRPFDEDEANRFAEAVYDVLPSAQPERKTGKWIFVRDEEAGNALYECSACGKGDIHAPEVKVSYCWNCGADMRGEQDG